jgi:hypothetical protein
MIEVGIGPAVDPEWTLATSAERLGFLEFGLRAVLGGVGQYISRGDKKPQIYCDRGFFFTVGVNPSNAGLEGCARLASVAWRRRLPWQGDQRHQCLTGAHRH